MARDVLFSGPDHPFGQSIQEHAQRSIAACGHCHGSRTITIDAKNSLGEIVKAMAVCPHCSGAGNRGIITKSELAS